jgi:MoxR-like ATPase
MRALALEVPLASHVQEFVTRLVYATHPESERASPMVKKYVRFGASPRGGQALIKTSKVSALVDGRFQVSQEDVISQAYNCLRHRIILSFEGEAEGVLHDDIIAEALKLAKKG